MSFNPNPQSLIFMGKREFLTSMNPQQFLDLAAKIDFNMEGAYKNHLSSTQYHQSLLQSGKPVSVPFLMFSNS